VPVDDILLHRPQVFFNKTIIQHDTPLYPRGRQKNKGQGTAPEHTGPEQARRKMGASPPTAWTGLSGAPLRSGPACGVAASPPSNPLRGWRVGCVEGVTRGWERWVKYIIDAITKICYKRV
jgi:hypothetical protein